MNKSYGGTKMIKETGIKRKRAFILIKKEKHDSVSKKIEELFKKHSCRKKDSIFSATGSVGREGTCSIIQIYREAFDTYQGFDSFLLELAKYYGDLEQDGGIVLGHTDAHGNLYKDYCSFYKEDSFIKSVKDSKLQETKNDVERL